MRKYRINWDIILRNIMIILFLICIFEELKIQYYNIKIEQIDQELAWINSFKEE